MSSLLVRPFAATDAEDIARVVAAAFGGKDEVDLIDTLRSDRDMIAEFVATANDRIIAHIAFSKLRVRHQDTTRRASALAPLAVEPGHQRAGAGTALTRSTLDSMRRAGEDLVVVLGHPRYYPRFGFSAVLAKLLDAPYSGPSFMALELSPGTLGGKRWQVTYANAFGPKPSGDTQSKTL